MAELEAAFGRGLHALPPAAFAQVRALVAADHRPELADLRAVPTLVISAEEDRVAPPSQGQVLAEAIGAELVIVPGGHAVPVQDAPRINHLLRDFWFS